MNGEGGREQLLRWPGAAPKNIDRPRVKGAFHRSVEQSKAGQD